MKSNILVIICSGISISIVGLIIIVAPLSLRLFLERNMECFLMIPPISVASYIFVFKYHEKFDGAIPPLGGLTGKLIEGAVSALIIFLLTAIVTSVVYRLITVAIK